MAVDRVLKVAVVIFFACLSSQVGSKRSVSRSDPPRDYGLSKWLENRAMDVMFSNETVAEVLFSKLGEILEKLALRPVRSPLPNSQLELLKGTKRIKNRHEILDSTMRVGALA